MPTQTGTSGADTINKSTATVSWTINGGAGNDTITGGSAADTLNGDAGADSITGGAGNDTINGGTENDTLLGGDGVDTITGGTGHDWLQGDAGVDYLYGDAGADSLYGGADTDYLYGGADADNIYGGSGDDRIYGGDGNDILRGQAGADRFYFEAPTAPDSYDPSTNPYVDTIKDFVDGTDKIYIITDSGLSPTWVADTYDTDNDGAADDTQITITFYPDDTTASATPIYVHIENVVSTSITNADVVLA